MVIVLTGGAGFLGSQLLRRLVKKGKVIALLRASTDCTRIADLLPGHDFEICHSTRDGICEAFANNRVDAVVHVSTNYGRHDALPLRTIEDNVVFPLQIAELAVLYGVPYFINTDSYFNKIGRDYNKLLFYSKSKRVFGEYLQLLGRKISVINVFLEHVYGESDNEDKFISQLVDAVAFRKDPRFPMTSGDQRLDFIHCADVVDAYVTLLENLHCFRDGVAAVEVGCGYTTSVGELARLVKSLSHSSTELDFGAIPMGGDEISYSVANIAKLRSLGWQPNVSLSDGLRRVVEYRSCAGTS